MKICTVFAGGEIRNTGFIDVSAVSESDLIICADSGLRYALEIGVKPDIVLGDFDSYVGELPEGVEIHRSPPEKDDTDTMLAVKTAIKRGCGEIRLYGALGARFDHSVANIQTLVYAHRHGCEMTILDESNEITVQGIGTREYVRRDGWYVSLFALTDTAAVGSWTGVKYPLTDTVLNIGFPLGVSNEIIGDKAVLRVDSGIILVVRSEM